MWSAGCACGEEVYSLKILWEQMSRSTGTLPLLDITATDLHPTHLERAAAAVYPLSSLKEVPETTRSTWFEAEPGGGRFGLKPALKEGIAWRRHDFLSGPPPSGFDLILVRNNLLTYYQSSLIRAPLEQMAKALSADGYLIIGSREKLPFPPARLHPAPPFALPSRGSSECRRDFFLSPAWPPSSAPYAQTMQRSLLPPPREVSNMWRVSSKGSR